ncbi:AA_permease-domain-containing protein [Sphaerulina musiva SO2202]|uniref:AA_permease-domain-containing protein n=1 Tax=Sphaerulina musiva (strain SO2202) TaxID=692275 RepID=M3AXU0_SPHMS|nr:AA_permease-domain-containing protein [Sphaerulina musiva SO2202]EMF11560.1 AA_permease-domain-containing protein [Sphaerulina musiva SO2202]
MSLQRESLDIGEKQQFSSNPARPASLADHVRGRQFSLDAENQQIIHADQNALHRSLKGRHMQMIAIGGAIGAGLFVGSGTAFQTGGPASVLLGFIIVGLMVYLMMQALAELAVMYPINGAFTMYIVRFVDPSWGFACGWQYAISWLTVLPFEISAACNIIHYWPGSEGINNSAWIVPLLVALVAIQFFGVGGYGEVEFVLSLIKILACIGFMILGIIINTGGVPTDDRGYIGGEYWHAPYSAFLNGFQGFCSVFVTAAFAYSGTELTGLAAAETVNPRKEVPRASNQTIWRIAIFYIVNLLLIGLIVPANSPLYSGDGPTSRRSPFVIAIQLAGIKVLPGIFNAVILISVMSVANSCTFGSTRTIQALASNGMGPKLFAYVDKQGRPLVVVIMQLLFGCLAFINLAKNGGDIFNWLLALSGLSILFIYGSVALAHIRFRHAWKANGHSLDELPFRAAFGVYGSYLCLLINICALVAQFYVALFPVGGTSLDAEAFFQAYLAGPFLLALYLGWKIYSWFVYPSHRRMWVAIKDIDLYTGMREEQKTTISGVEVTPEVRRASIDEMHGEKKKGAMDYVKAPLKAFF